MRCIQKLKVRTRVALAFAAVLCCTIALASFALQQLAAVNGLAAAIRNDALPSTRLLGTMAQTAERIRLYQYVAATTQSQDRRNAMLAD